EALELGSTETVRWQGGDGWEIQGLLVRPAGYEPGRRLPLVVQVHGGPASLWPHRFYAAVGLWAQLLAARGIAVLLPNPRGSVGWGSRFSEANLGDMGGQDWRDILAGVDYCVETGVADPDRLGIGGWSYGGFMTAWAVTQTPRFKAAMMGAGVSDWFALMGTTPEPMWTEQVHFEAWPWDDPHAFRKNSPIEFVKQVRTPVLILHGENDNMVAVSQAREFYRALQHYNVPSEFVVYPREGHGIHETAHKLD